ncbi:MAG: hypothetical protein QNJ22_10105 [Desulfosarcinaceae bacterium]|nr:hypothetical protein [Desulfosarcinaceae bacterium]
MGKQQVVVELDGLLYRRQGPQLTQVPDLRDVAGDYVLISDLQGSMARSMIVEAEPRYVELLVARRLQEAGEFDEPVTVISHWKKKLGRNTTSILFTAVPTRIYLQYREQLRESAHSIALYPLTALLYQTLKRVAARQPVALLFQHGRFVDLILGTRRRIYMANRYVAYDDSLEQRTTLWERIAAELSEAADEHRISIERACLLDWVDAAQAPPWTSENGLAVTHLVPETLLWDGETHPLALFKQVAKLPLGATLATPMERCMLLANRLALPLNLAALLLALLLAAGGIHHHGRQTALGRQIQQHQATLTKTLAALPAPPALRNYEAPLAFAKTLDKNLRTPGLCEVLRDLSRAVGRGMQLVDLDARYEPQGLTVSVTGRIEAPFQDAHASYQRFLRLLQSRRYTIAMDQFDTQIRHSQFRVQLTRSL